MGDWTAAGAIEARPQHGVLVGAEIKIEILTRKTSRDQATENEMIPRLENTSCLSTVKTVEAEATSRRNVVIAEEFSIMSAASNADSWDIG